jgi:hypothetical protein
MANQAGRMSSGRLVLTHLHQVLLHRKNLQPPKQIFIAGSSI